MRVRWTPAAANDLEQIGNYLKERYSSLAHATALKLYSGAQSLRKFPPGQRNVLYHHPSWMVIPGL